jgi:hypothetical protein
MKEVHETSRMISVSRLSAAAAADMRVARRQNILYLVFNPEYFLNY